MKRSWFLLLLLVLLFAAQEATAQENQSNDSIYLAARPDSVSFTIASTAIIVIDMQNDFGAKGGMFDRAGINISGIQKVVDPIANVLAAARKKGIQIIYLKMGFKPDLSDMGSTEFPTRMKRAKRLHVGDTVSAPDGTKGRILVSNTWNTEILPGLQPQANDIVISKNRFNGFYQTSLDSLLRSLGKKYLILTGCTTSICVESTARDASFRGFMPVVLGDCTAEPIGSTLPRTNHDASLLIIQTSFGLVSSSAEFIKSLDKPVKAQAKPF